VILLSKNAKNIWEDITREEAEETLRFLLVVVFFSRVIEESKRVCLSAFESRLGRREMGAGCSAFLSDSSLATRVGR
jgi:hypothetical protein